MTTIRVERVYDRNTGLYGFRVLVDRLWPRGLSKETARVDLWAKDIAPSNQLRSWYKHEPTNWLLFKTRYFEELDDKRAEIEKLTAIIAAHDVILLYASRCPLNNAVALKEYLETKSQGLQT